MSNHARYLWILIPAVIAMGFTLVCSYYIAARYLRAWLRHARLLTSRRSPETCQGQWFATIIES